MADIDTYIKDLETRGRAIEFVNPKQGFILRLDGHSFSRFTKPLEKPYDMAFSKAMIETALELKLAFNATTSYTHSDEITLYFPSVFSEEKDCDHMFGGKIMKLVSYSAGLASTTFTLSFIRILKEQDRDDIIKFVVEYKPYFDSRIIVVNDPAIFVKHDIFRSQMDCFRNTISKIYMYVFSKKMLHKVSLKEQLQKIKEKGIDVSTIPFHLRHGVYIKMILVEINVEVKGKKVKAIRKRPVFIGHRARENEESISFLTSKYFEGDIPSEHIDYVLRDNKVIIDLSKDFDRLRAIQVFKN